jgi:biopolymer transport protein ExbD
VRFGKKSGDFERLDMMMTPMIDVCFQMLVFFVMNMRILSPEGNFNIEMPAAAAQAGVPADDAQIPPVKVRILADKSGNMAGIVMGQRKLGSFHDLRQEMKQICGLDRGPAAAAETPEVDFECDYGLKYQYVVEAVTAVTGYVSNDDRTIVRMIEKIRFVPQNSPKEAKNSRKEAPRSPKGKGKK